MPTISSPARTSALALLLAAASALGQPTPRPLAAFGPETDKAIRGSLGLTAYTVQNITPIPSPGGYSIPLNLGGLTFSLALTLDPTDSPDCIMTIDDGSGTLVNLPPPAPCTYRGTVAGLPGSVASGSIIDGRFTGIVILPGEMGAWNVLPLVEVSPTGPAAAHIVSRFDDSLAGDWTCGVADQAPHHQPRHPPTGTGTPDAPLICELAIDADYPYFQLVNGTASNVAQDIATVIANASSYSILSNTNVKFRIVRYVIRTTAGANPGYYNTTSADSLLNGFRIVWNNLAGVIPRDAAHLFTGRDLSGTTIGIAYVSAVCSPVYGYGLSQSRFNMQPGRRAALTSHEIGHNFSANHCDASNHLCSPCWLMSATQGSTTNQLTRYGCSAPIIASYAIGRSCLGTSDSTSPGCPADFDGSGSLDTADFAAFAAAFAAGQSRADLDRDGRLTIHDHAAFTALYAAGCD
jgi:hypothetical protein